MKKLLRTTYLAASMVLAVTPAIAANNSDTFGAGTSTCTQFAAAYRAGRGGQGSQYVETFFFSWAQGFMTASNMARYAVGNTSKNLSAWPLKTQEEHVREYCADNPLKSYGDAVMDLFTSLPENPASAIPSQE